MFRKKGIRPDKILHFNSLILKFCVTFQLHITSDSALRNSNKCVRLPCSKTGQRADLYKVYLMKFGRSHMPLLSNKYGIFDNVFHLARNAIEQKMW